MVWSGFRASDDPQVHCYNVPANMYLWGALRRLLVINDAVWQDAELRAAAAALMDDVHTGITTHGIVQLPPASAPGTGAGAGGGGGSGGEGVRVYAYEVDGHGKSLLNFDDPNLPSLLALPLLGYERYDPAVYAATRSRIFSDANPFHFRGSELQGLGSPHTGQGYIWPLATAVEALTSDTVTARANALRSLLKMAAGNGLVHESVHMNSIAQFTRAEFGWANAMLVVAVEQLLGVDCDAAAEEARLQAISTREAAQPGQMPNGGRDQPAYYEMLEATVEHLK